MTYNPTGHPSEPSTAYHRSSSQTLADIASAVLSRNLTDEKPENPARPKCRCRCGCRGRSGRRIACRHCQCLIGPGCCLDLHLNDICHVCAAEIVDDPSASSTDAFLPQDEIIDDSGEALPVQFQCKDCGHKGMIEGGEFVEDLGIECQNCYSNDVRLSLIPFETEDEIETRATYQVSEVQEPPLPAEENSDGDSAASSDHEEHAALMFGKAINTYQPPTSTHKSIPYIFAEAGCLAALPAPVFLAVSLIICTSESGNTRSSTLHLSVYQCWKTST